MPSEPEGDISGFVHEASEAAFDAFLLTQDAAFTDTCHVCGTRKPVSRWPLCGACHGNRVARHALKAE